MKGGGPPRWQSGKESHSEEDLAWIPGLGRSPAGGQGNPLQCSCLENSVERGAWWAGVFGGHTESDTTEVT